MARYCNINRVNAETLFRPKPPYFDPKVFIKLILNPEKRTTGVFSVVGLVCSGTFKVKYGSCDTSFLRVLIALPKNSEINVLVLVVRVG